jgi:hypothetical protein
LSGGSVIGSWAFRFLNAGSETHGLRVEEGGCSMAVPDLLAAYLDRPIVRFSWRMPI